MCEDDFHAGKGYLVSVLPGMPRTRPCYCSELIDSDVLVNGFTREKGSLETVFTQLTDHEEEKGGDFL